MKRLRSIYFLILALFLIGASTKNKYKYEISNNNSVTIHGKSTVRDWDEKIGNVSGFSTVSWNKDGSFNLEEMTIKMVVKSIKSGMGPSVDNNTYQSLRADVNPYIIFKLMAPVKSIRANSKMNAYLIMGNLSIAGVTRFEEMTIRINLQKNNTITYQGVLPLWMPDFRVVTPDLFFGTVKTSNQVSINFDLTLVKTV